MSDGIPVCSYHQLLHLDPTGSWQVNSACESPDRMVHRPWFVLPPVEEYYYRSKNPSYQPPPPFRADCTGAVADAAEGADRGCLHEDERHDLAARGPGGARRSDEVGAEDLVKTPGAPDTPRRMPVPVWGSSAWRSSTASAR